MRISSLSARLSASYLGAWLRRRFSRASTRERLGEEQRKKSAELLAETMGQMKGAFMKLGQMVSFVSEDVPPHVREALAQLQAQAPAMPFPLLRDTLEKELGRPLERAFARFNVTPLASASIGQVHRAQLPSGEEVVVKIQYPGVADAIRADLANVNVLYGRVGLMYPNLDPGPQVDELRARIGEELDYLAEARSQRAFLDLYGGHPFIRVPRLHDEYCTPHVLTSEFVAGQSFGEVLAAAPSPAEEARRQRFGEIIYRFVFGSIWRYGVFNGDPHPGNYLFDADGKVVFLDYGCVKYFSPELMVIWKSVIAAHLSGDRQRFKRCLADLGFFDADNKVEAELIYDFFGEFYRPWREDVDFEFTARYASQTLKLVFQPEGRFAPLRTQVKMPPDFVFVNRIQWGVYSILGQLAARGNFHRIHAEYLHEAEPASELGRLDAAYRKSRPALAAPAPAPAAQSR
jgi:predicted unusual protein kinase regulating ubiquinone biosynthesis (AarF/ABC1/UbiB family)